MKTSETIIKTREQARSDLNKYFFTGLPCVHGHIVNRYTSTGQCVECQRQRRIQFKTFHPDKLKISVDKSYKKHHAKRLREKKIRRSLNQNQIRKYSQEYIKNNYSLYLWYYAKRRAKNKNLEFSITPEDIIIPKICPILNIELDTTQGRGRFRYNTPTLDRINNTRGYTINNIQVISWRANELKADGTIEEFQQLLDFMKNNKNKEF